MEQQNDKASLLKIGIELQLKAIFQKSHFDVCSFKEIVIAMGGSRDIPQDIHLFHCVNYTEMGTETKARLFKRCIEVMAEACCWNQFVDEATEHLGLNDHKKTLTIQLEHPKGFFKRLLG